MKIGVAFAFALLAASSAALAAPPKYISEDHSADALMDDATAKALWAENLSLRLSKLYPVGKWGFASEVQGGFTSANNCVVTARAMMLPRSARGLVFKPAKTTTTFDTIPGASMAQCKDLSKRKLQEAIQALTSALAPK